MLQTFYVNVERDVKCCFENCWLPDLFTAWQKLLISSQPCMTDISVCDKATPQSALLSLSFTHRAPSAATQMVTLIFLQSKPGTSISPIALTALNTPGNRGLLCLCQVMFTWRWCCCERRCPCPRRLCPPSRLVASHQTQHNTRQRTPGSSTPRVQTYPWHHLYTWASPSLCRPEKKGLKAYSIWHESCRLTHLCTN